MPSAPRLWSAVLFIGSCLAPALRAQVTETPQTQGAGSVLMRMDAVSFGVAEDTAAPNQYKALAVGTTLISAGITPSLDFELGTQLFLRDTFDKAGSDHTESGIGDVTLRPKWTFWRDTESGQAAAIIPYVTLPTHSKAVGNDATEGGLIVPWSMDIAAGLRAAAMVQWDVLRNVADTRYDSRWYASAFLKWALGGVASAYAEGTLSDSTAGASTASGTFGGGATLAVSHAFEWDFEVSRVVGSGRNSWNEVIRFRWKIL